MEESPAVLAPLCFVLMPFGKKKDPKGGPDIDFNRVYDVAIHPAIVDAGMEPVRADAEKLGGIIHKAMFERLLLCDYAVADLTTANANVFYELGVRHTARPKTTVALCASGAEVPFDLRYLRYMPYELGGNNAFSDADAQSLREALAKSLRSCRELSAQDALADSPLFQLLQGYAAPELAHLVTDSFRDRARYSEEMRRRIARARGGNKADAAAALDVIRAEVLGAIDAVEMGSLVDLFLSYRAVEAWNSMVEIYARFPAELQRTVMVREQLAFAHNRRAQQGDRDRALELLAAVEKERGSNPETCGLIGRIHKDNWLDALKAGDKVAASGHLDAAIDAYLRGYEADWRDFYPGVNAVTLLDIRGDDGDIEKKDRLLPVVRYAVERRSEGKDRGYWENATELELAILGGDRKLATRLLARAIACIREAWEPKSTANNLELIARARSERGVDVAWIHEIAAELLKPRG